ncbi:ECs1072 family phage-associated protein [Phytobacter sp. V91]|uniref:ECs1072 family phage-associated protein n=1 Tax=Phytobacter sp. V91 TaxID=3369425 RepID=UPI003F5EA51E
MSVINVDYFQVIQNKIAEHHGVKMQGYIEPPYYQVQNRAVLIFSLETILEEHRAKFGTLTSPLKGKLALEHLLLRKYKWPLSEIRSLSLQDALFALQEELALEHLPEKAQEVIKMFNAHRARTTFDQIVDAEWDPEMYLTIPKPQNW